MMLVPYLLHFIVQDFKHQIPLPAQLTNLLGVTFVLFEYILSKILVSGIIPYFRMNEGKAYRTLPGWHFLHRFVQDGINLRSRKAAKVVYL